MSKESALNQFDQYTKGVLSVNTFNFVTVVIPYYFSSPSLLSSSHRQNLIPLALTIHYSSYCSQWRT